MKKSRRYSIHFILFLSILLIVSCKGGGGDGGGDGVNEGDKWNGNDVHNYTKWEDFYNDYRVQEISETGGINLYQGDNPPNLVGTYQFDYSVIYDTNDYYFSGGPDDLYITKQTPAPGNIVSLSIVEGTTLILSGAYPISGDEGYFTIYAVADEYLTTEGDDCYITVMHVLSGKMNNTELSELEWGYGIMDVSGICDNTIVEPGEITAFACTLL